MKKANFLKVCAFAAVALFATSCSEETLDINGGSINVPEFTLPAPTASISVTVVDLEAGKIVGKVTTVDATAAIGSTMTVNCPANEGYTKAAAIEVAVPTLQKGQAINIPVTFYVVKLESAYADLMEEVVLSYTDKEGEEYILYNELTFINENGWKDGSYTNTNEETVEKIAYFGNYLTGFHFEEATSRAIEHETSIEELLAAGMVFDKGIYEELVKISGLHIFTHSKVVQEIHISDIVLKNHKGEVIYSFTAQRAGNVITVGFETPITHDAPGHDAPGHGHDHGNNNNAGGGIGGNEGE